jgi:hypothetical protein
MKDHSRDSETKAWLLDFFASVLAEPGLRQRVHHHAALVQEPDAPQVTPSDVQASVPYLRACILNMTPDEASTLSVDDLAALWARGAAGAAKYRTRANVRPVVDAGRDPIARRRRRGLGTDGP